MAALSNLAGYLLREGEEEAARQTIEEGLPLLRAARLTRPVAQGLGWLGWIARRQGEAPSAAPLFAESISVAGEMSFLSAAAMSCKGLAGLAVDAGDALRAAQLLGVAERLRAEREVTPHPRLRHWVAPIRAAVQAALGQDGYAAASAAGRGLSRDAAVALALAQPPRGAD